MGEPVSAIVCCIISLPTFPCVARRPTTCICSRNPALTTPCPRANPAPPTTAVRGKRNKLVHTCLFSVHDVACRAGIACVRTLGCSRISCIYFLSSRCASTRSFPPSSRRARCLVLPRRYCVDDFWLCRSSHCWRCGTSCAKPRWLLLRLFASYFVIPVLFLHRSASSLPSTPTPTPLLPLPPPSSLSFVDPLSMPCSFPPSSLSC